MEASVKGQASDGIARRLRAFLRTLPVETCIRVMDALEHARLAGESFPGADMIAGELVAVITAQRRRPARASNPQRHVFALFEPFLIDEPMPDKQAGRIERASLAPIWLWLLRDLAPALMAAYEADVLAALLAGDADKAKALTAALHKGLTPLIRAAVTPRHDEAEQRKAIAAIGGQRAFDDLGDMLAVLEHRDALKGLAERIPGPVRQVDEGQTASIAALLGPYARGDAALLPFAASVAMSRLAVPSQIVRVAASAAESHQVARIQATPFAVVIDLVAADVERALARAEAARQDQDVGRLATAARDFAHGVRALVTDLEMTPELAVARRLGATRSRMAQLLRPEVETLPARVRQILKARAGDARPQGGTLDEAEITAVEAGLDILLIAKSHAAELALNEATLRVFSELQSFLDAGVNPLLDGLRGMAGEDRAYRLRQLDAAVRVAQRVLGGSYAALLAKAVDVAAGDRRPAAKSA